MNEINDSEAEDVLIRQEHELDLNNDRDNNKDNICNSYFFASIIFLIESIISIGIFYALYFFEIAKLYQILQMILIYLFLFLYFFIPLYARTKFYRNHKICGNIIFFILISINKILFLIIIHIACVFYSNKIKEFPNFEARVYWKFSMFLFYLFLMFFSFFRKDSETFGIFYYMSFAIISLIAMILLIFFRYKNDDKWEIEGIYIALSIHEMTTTISSIFIAKKNKMTNGPFLFAKDINWVINKIDFYRNYYLYFSIILFSFKVYCIKCYKNSRCFKMFINNFSAYSDKRNIFSQDII